MMGLRYHVVSLVAVFVALGLGILVGASLAGDDGLLSQQRALIDRLHTDFDRLARERDALAADLALLQRYADESMPYVVHGKLAGRSLAIIGVGITDAGVLSTIGRIIGLAGGQVAATITLTDIVISNSSAAQAGVWAQAIASSDYGRVRSLASLGVARVKMPKACRFDSVLMVLESIDAGGPKAGFVDATLRAVLNAKMTAVVGWTHAPRTPDIPQAALLSGAPQPSQVPQAYGVGHVQGAVAAVIALSGAEGTYGMPPAHAFLPALVEGGL